MAIARGSSSLLDVEAPSRIALVRALKLGDMLCGVPALRALRAAVPDAEIVLVGLVWARAFAERFDRYLDGFLELPGYPGLAEAPVRVTEIPRFLAEAHAMRFDLAIQLHGSGVVTNPLTVLLGARRNAGFCVPGHWCPDEDGFVPYPDDEPEIRRNLRLMAFLGAPPRGEELEFPLTDDDVDELHALEEASDLEPGTYVCVHPGASVAERRWPPERFAEVADGLARSGFRVVVTGTAAEADVAARVAAGMRTGARVLAGRTSLGALGALLAGARLLVSNDTGVAHLATALRVPSVVLFSPAQVLRWAPLDRTLHRVVPTPASPAAVLAEAEDVLARERAATG